MMGCGWTRYPWENIANWQFFWVADPQYVDVTGQRWLAQKGGVVLTVPSGNTFPTFQPTGWGPKLRGCLSFNGTTDLLSSSDPKLPPLVNGLAEFTQCLAAQITQTPIVQNMHVFNFASNSDTLDAIVTQTDINRATFTNPFRCAVVPHTGPGNFAYYTTNGDNNRHVTSFAWSRNVASSNYIVESSTYDGANTVMTQSGTTNFTTQTLTVLRINAGGFWGVSKLLFGSKIRSIGLSPVNMSFNTAVPSGEQLAPAVYLAAFI